MKTKSRFVAEVRETEALGPVIHVAVNECPDGSATEAPQPEPDLPPTNPAGGILVRDCTLAIAGLPSSANDYGGVPACAAALPSMLRSTPEQRRPASEAADTPLATGK
jgi:hypothetical protein